MDTTHPIVDASRRQVDVRALRLVRAFDRLRPQAPASELVCRDGHLEVGRGTATAAVGPRRLAVRDALMSTVHFAVSRENSGWAVVDLASKNGTYVDGNRVLHHMLVEGDIIEAGASYFVVGFEDPVLDAPRKRPDPDAPLRERRAELGVLIGDILGRLGSKQTLTRPAARALFQYDWPHDVEELEHALALALGAAIDSAQIGVEHLPGAIQSFVEEASASASGRFRTLVTRYEGNVTSLSRALGASPSQVRRLARRYACSLDARR